MTPDLRGATLPPGWKAEAFGAHPHLLEIKRARDVDGFYGYVAIDFTRRIFSGGSGQPRKHAGTSTYAGRGWKKQIIEDACAWLEKEMGDALEEKPCPKQPMKM